MGPGPIGARRLILWLVVFKACYAVLLGVGLWWGSDFDRDRFEAVNARWPREGGPVFASHLATWDAAHYLFLSEVGYREGVPSCAFYPLWPMLIRGFSFFTGGSHLIAGLVLANAFSVAGWFLFYRLASRRFGERIGWWALVFLVLFPGSIFYQFIYSESLFFLLLMSLWWGLERQRYGTAWMAAVLLPLARGVGVFCVLPIGWHWLMRQRWGWLDRWSWLKEERRRIFGGRERGAGSEVVGRADAGRGESRSSPSAPLFVALAPPLGLGFVFLLMWHWTGNAWEGIEAQRFWGVHSMSNLWDVPKFVKGLAEPEVWHAFRGSVLDRCMFILLLYTVPLIWKMGKDMLWWTYALGVLPAMSGTFVSFTRFESVVFPLFIALAMFFTSFKRQWPLVVFAALMGAGHVWMLWRFVNFRWAG